MYMMYEMDTQRINLMERETWNDGQRGKIQTSV